MGTMKPSQNPNPHHRSKSMMTKRGTKSSFSSSSSSQALPSNNNHQHHREGHMLSALSTALDCAIAGSSSKIVHGLNQLDEGDPKSGGMLNRQDRRQEQQDRNRNYVDQDPHSRYQDHSDGMLNSTNRITPPAQRRMNRMTNENPARYTDLLNSTMLNDHFDQYRTNRDDSGLGKELYTDERYTRNTPMDPSPDSGVSDTDDLKSRPLQRRKTLPSIVKRANDSSAPAKTTDNIHSSEDLSSSKKETFIIENGIRKRVQAEVYPQPRPAARKEPIVTKDLPKRYKLEASNLASSGGNRGSLPDVRACKTLEKNVMPREEVSKLSTLRREELRRMAEEEARRKAGELVLSIDNVKVGIFIITLLLD